MDRKKAEYFFTNVNWFNSFFNDMKGDVVPIIPLQKQIFHFPPFFLQ